MVEWTYKEALTQAFAITAMCTLVRSNGFSLTAQDNQDGGVSQEVARSGASGSATRWHEARSKPEKAHRR